MPALGSYCCTRNKTGNVAKRNIEAGYEAVVTVYTQ